MQRPFELDAALRRHLSMARRTLGFATQPQQAASIMGARVPIKAPTGPNWKAGTNPEQDWSASASKYGLTKSRYASVPAVYLIKGASGASYELQVAIEVTKSKGVSRNAKLVGRLAGMEIEGSCPTGTGEHTVTAEITQPTEQLREFRGPIAWGLELSAMSYALASTFVELYFILDTPTPTYASTGVWAEVLRFVFGRIGVTGSERQDASVRITRFCHRDHGLRYDTFVGASHYLDNASGHYRIGDYMEKSSPIANCVDQAFAVQAFAGAIGIVHDFLQLRPFGYIQPADLLGVGRCNNPFFGAHIENRMVA